MLFDLFSFCPSSAQSAPLWQRLVNGLIFSAVLVPTAHSQTVTLGLPHYDQVMRRAQLLGQVDTNISFCLNPVDLRRAAGHPRLYGLDSVLFPTEGFATPLMEPQPFGKRGRGEWHLLPLVGRMRYSGHHPYGWQDGPMIPAKGWQQLSSMGARLRYGRLEVQLRPEWVTADNQQFDNPPVRVVKIDNPDRMGTEPYRAAFWGQSFAKLHFGPLALGYGSENVWWGPGLRGAMLMSNNAPGVRHATIHSNRPIRTPIGHFEFQLMGFRPQYSGFFGYATTYDTSLVPPRAPDIQPEDTLAFLGTSPHSWVSAGMVTWQPSFIPGLFVGATRGVQMVDKPRRLPLYYLSAFLPADTEGEYSDQGQFGRRNQLVSVFGRYLFHQSNAEVYAEIGREDWWYDHRDFINDPDHTTAWLLGMRRIYGGHRPNRFVEVTVEYTRTQNPASMIARGFGYSFYTHNTGRGWTHRGQIMGEGMPPGSNRHYLGVLWVRGHKQFGGHIERVVYSEDMFLSGRMPFLNNQPQFPGKPNYTKRFVDISPALSLQTRWRGIIIGSTHRLMRTYNFQWVYRPGRQAPPRRDNDYNIWSYVLDAFVVYRF